MLTCNAFNILELVRKLNELNAGRGYPQCRSKSGVSEFSFCNYFGNTVIVFHLTHSAALIDYGYCMVDIHHLENEVCFQRLLTTY